VIVSLQRIWSKPLNSYGLVLQSLYEPLEASKCSCQRKVRNLRFH